MGITVNGKNVINLEVYEKGAPRFYYRTNHVAYTIQFKTDIRSTNKTHLAVTIDGGMANLFVNGVLVESVLMSADLPETTQNFCIGGDARTENHQNFKGEIYSVHLFDSARTPEEILKDSVFVNESNESLVYNAYFEKN